MAALAAALREREAEDGGGGSARWGVEREREDDVVSVSSMGVAAVGSNADGSANYSLPILSTGDVSALKVGPGFFWGGGGVRASRGALGPGRG